MILASLQPIHWVFIGVGIFLLASLLFGLWITFETARRVYLHTLSTKMGESWGRVCSAPDNPEQMQMWNDGIAYMKQFEDKKEEVSIINDGLKLCGEFFDFGAKKTALFLCGRCECAFYAYYYAQPYIESGLNVLFIDPRAHGLSEGKLSTAGIKEGQDGVAWMKFLKEKKGQEKVVIHTLCVGGTAGLIAATSDFGHEMVEKIVCDGLFINFLDSYRRHYVDLGHKTFPVYYQIWFWFKLYTGVSVKLSDPYKYVQQLSIPILFIHTKNDKFSVPENLDKLYNVCSSKEKKIAWFDVGSHSHIRNHATKEYDQSIKDFLTVH